MKNVFKNHYYTKTKKVEEQKRNYIFCIMTNFLKKINLTYLMTTTKIMITDMTIMITK